uniref:Septin-type G domain-containing protein n=1 Tax=Amphimedon queenslandica TaxID=400682 RepID=A0A1X7TLB3_AMPQE
MAHFVNVAAEEYIDLDLDLHVSISSINSVSKGALGTEEFDSEPIEKQILILGETGVGKSYLINALFGNTLDIKAQVSRDVKAQSHEPIVKHTAQVMCKVEESFTCTKLTIYDTRGFADPTHKDEALFKNYTKMIDIDKLDAVYICHRISGRFNDSSVRFAELLAKHFFKENEVIWSKCILVLTQANLFEIEEEDDDDDDNDDNKKMCAALRMLESMKQWSLAFDEALVQLVPKKIYLQIPVCVAGSKRNVKLPVRDDWVEELLHATLQKCYNKTREIKAINQSKRDSVGRSIIAGGAIGAGVAATLLPVVGLPLGLTIGALIGWKYGEKSAGKEAQKKIQELIET